MSLVDHQSLVIDRRSLTFSKVTLTGKNSRVVTTIDSSTLLSIGAEGLRQQQLCLFGLRQGRLVQGIVFKGGFGQIRQSRRCYRSAKNYNYHTGRKRNLLFSRDVNSPIGISFRRQRLYQNDKRIYNITLTGTYSCYTPLFSVSLLGRKPKKFLLMKVTILI